MYEKINYPFYNNSNKYNMNSQSRKDYNNYRYNMNNQISNQNTSLERKQDTRKKILLGGLIIKAGLDYLHPKDIHILYGMLLASKKLLINNPEIANNWREMGKNLKKVSREIKVNEDH